MLTALPECRRRASRNRLDFGIRDGFGRHQDSKKQRRDRQLQQWPMVGPGRQLSSMDGPLHELLSGRISRVPEGDPCPLKRWAPRGPVDQGTCQALAQRQDGRSTARAGHERPRTAAPARRRTFRSAAPPRIFGSVEKPAPGAARGVKDGCAKTGAGAIEFVSGMASMRNHRWNFRPFAPNIAPRFQIGRRANEHSQDCGVLGWRRRRQPGWRRAVRRLAGERRDAADRRGSGILGNRVRLARWRRLSRALLLARGRGALLRPRDDCARCCAGPEARRRPIRTSAGQDGHFRRGPA